MSTPNATLYPAAAPCSLPVSHSFSTSAPTLTSPTPSYRMNTESQHDIEAARTQQCPQIQRYTSTSRRTHVSGWYIIFLATITILSIGGGIGCLFAVKNLSGPPRTKLETAAYNTIIFGMGIMVMSSCAPPLARKRWNRYGYAVFHIGCSFVMAICFTVISLLMNKS